MLRFFKRKEIEKRMWEAVDKLSQWEEHVRWLSPTYPVLIDISDRIKEGRREMMSSRNAMIEKYGDSGVSLAELIVINDALRTAAVEEGGWTSCQCNSQKYIPFFFSAEVEHLFNTHPDMGEIKTRIPSVVINVSKDDLIEVFESAIKRLYSERKLQPFTYSAPSFKFVDVNCGTTASTIKVEDHILVQPFQHFYYQG